MPSLLSRSAVELAAAIRAGRESSRDVVEAHIARIQATHGALNAVVADRFDAARREADAADERARTGEPLPAFHGVPCTIKEAFALAGMPNCSGLVARRGHIADRDATAVARLRAAGFIPLGVTNTSELCMWLESDNKVYGRTSSAYSDERTSGGSSGGEGAVIGAGGSPVGLGSDIGGSIRMPAFFNGVFGHKPSGGLVPGTGQFPLAHGDALRILATGPLCRRAADLHPVLGLLAGPDGVDEGCRPMELGDPAAVRLDELRVLDVADAGGAPVDGELGAAQRRAARALARRGAQVIEARIPAFERSFELWSARLSSAGGPSFSAMLGQGTPIAVVPAIAAWIAGRSPHTLPALGLALVEPLPALLGQRAREALQTCQDLRAELNQLLGSDGVILYPPYATLPPRHGVPLLPFRWVYTAIWNALELPVTQVPLGLSDEGLPLGVQVVAAHGQDAVALAVALALEQDFGGWVPPPRLPAIR